MNKNQKVGLGILGAAGLTGLVVALTRKKKGPPLPPPPGEVLANLYGRVQNTVTQNLIAGVVVTIAGQQTTSDASGNYVFTGIAPGSYSINATANGFELWGGSPSITLVAGDNEFVIGMAPVLEVGAGIAIDILTQLEAGTSNNQVKVTFINTTISGVTPAAYSFKAHIRVSCGLGTLLDSDDSLSLAASAQGTVTKTFNIPMEASGYFNVSAWLNSSDDSLMLVVPVVVSGTIGVAPAGLTGHVYQSATVYPGPALSGVLVSIGGKTATTDANGRYSIDGIPPGDYTISFSKSGYMTGTYALTVTSGANVFDFNIALSVVTLYGQVFGTDTNQPLAGVNIAITGGPSAVTDSSGNFSFPDMAYGGYAITFSKTGYQTQSLNILLFPIGGTQMIVNMIPAPPPPPPTDLPFTFGTPTATMAPDPLATAWQILQVSCTITNNNSSTQTRNIECVSNIGPRNWADGNIWKAVTLLPGQSITLVSPYTYNGGTVSNTPPLSIQSAQRRTDWQLWMQDDLGNRSPVLID